MPVVIVLSYLALACLVVFLSIKLSQYVDMLDKITKLSGALIGGVFLAAVTSLPELFTSISAVLFLGQSELVLGNMLGSDIFNAALLGLILLIFFRSFAKEKTSKSLIWTGLFLVGLYGIGIYATLAKHQLLFWGVNALSIVIMVVYMISIKFIAGETDKDKDKTVELSKQQIIIRFVIASVLLVTASIGITYLSDSLADILGLGKTLAGAVLLGVATSLPEVVSTANLIKMGNHEAGISNILGSNTFNFVILSLADFMNYKASIYNNNLEAKYLLFGGLASVVSFSLLLVIKSWKNKQNFSTKLVSMILCIVPIVTYALFLIIPNL